MNNSTTNKTLKTILTVVHIIIQNSGNNCDIHRSLENSFKISKPPKKYENIKSTYCIS